MDVARDISRAVSDLACSRLVIDLRGNLRRADGPRAPVSGARLSAACVRAIRAVSHGRTDRYSGCASRDRPSADPAWRGATRVPDMAAPGMLIAAAVMLLAAGLLPGFSLAAPVNQRLPLVLIAVQAVVFAGQFRLLVQLQKIGFPVLLSLLGSVGAIVGVPVAIFLQGARRHALQSAQPSLSRGSAEMYRIFGAAVTVGRSICR